MGRLKEYLHKYIQNPIDPYVNAALGEEYEKIEQGAAALSYFLRAAELTHESDPELAYCCILKTWKQLNKTTRRPFFEQEQLQTAIAFQPKRPEAYLHLSMWHSNREEWKAAYMYACLGLEFINNTQLPYDIGYPGDYMLLFQKAFTGWYIGQIKESENLWLQLSGVSNVRPEHMMIIKSNLDKFGLNPLPPDTIELKEILNKTH